MEFQAGNLIFFREKFPASARTAWLYSHAQHGYRARFFRDFAKTMHFCDFGNIPKCQRWGITMPCVPVASFFSQGNFKIFYGFFCFVRFRGAAASASSFRRPPELVGCFSGAVVWRLWGAHVRRSSTPPSLWLESNSPTVLGHAWSQGA